MIIKQCKTGFNWGGKLSGEYGLNRFFNINQPPDKLKLSRRLNCFVYLNFFRISFTASL